MSGGAEGTGRRGGMSKPGFSAVGRPPALLRLPYPQAMSLRRDARQVRGAGFRQLR